MSVKEAILKLSKKWRTYDQIIIETEARLAQYRSTQNIGRRCRELVNDGKLLSRRVKGKSYSEFKRI